MTPATLTDDYPATAGEPPRSTIPYEPPRRVTVMGTTPDGWTLVVWHELVQGAWIRISWVVPKSWVTA
jgi:hypothetical protein